MLREGHGVRSHSFTHTELLWFLHQRYGGRLKVEFGPGRRKQKPPWASIGLNMSADPVADIFHDLEEGIPLPANSVATIYSNQFLEHIEHIIPHMNECWRVLIPGGKVEACVPHRDSPWAVADPTHKRTFVPESFQYFCLDTTTGEPFVDAFSDYGIECAFILERCMTRPRVDIQVILRKP